jgi:hypothetical protein
VAAAALKRWLWPAVAVIAAAFIVVLAFHGERPGLAPFEAAGLMAHVRPDRVRVVEVTSAAGVRRFRRSEDGRWSGETPGGERSALIDEALRYLHVTRPERVIGSRELAGQALTALGLDPPVVTVTVVDGGGSRFVVHFGAPNPLGVSRYARLDARSEVMLMPRHLADAWDRVAAAEI